MGGMTKEQLDSLREFLDGNDLFLLCSQGGMVTYCSGKLRELLGEDLQGRSLHYFVKDEDAARIILAAQTGKEETVDGSVGARHFRCRMRPNQDKSFSMALTPVSPEGTAFIRHSTAALMQRELRDSIQVILTALGQMAPAESGGEQLYRAMIHRQTLKMLRLSDNMMDLARYQNGEAQMRVSELDLRRLMQECAQQVELYGSGTLRVIQELPEEPCLMQGDRDMLMRILLNLICNSLQAAGNQPLTIRMRLTYQHDQYRIVYQDNAPVDREAMENFFHKYLSKNPEEPSSLGGAGFGLNLVEAFADLHGGSLMISSTPDGSPVFVVSLKNAREEGDRQSSRLRSELFRYQDGADLVLKELSPVLDVSAYIRK